MDTKTVTTSIGTAILTATITAVIGGYTVPKDETKYTRIDADTVQVDMTRVEKYTKTFKISDYERNLVNFDKAVAEAEAKEPLSEETRARLAKLRASIQSELDGAKQIEVTKTNEITK